jgi:hypothetical protein
MYSTRATAFSLDLTSSLEATRKVVEPLKVPLSQCFSFLTQLNITSSSRAVSLWRSRSTGDHVRVTMDVSRSASDGAANVTGPWPAHTDKYGLIKV